MVDDVSGPCLYLLPEIMKGESLKEACARWRVVTESGKGTMWS